MRRTLHALSKFLMRGNVRSCTVAVKNFGFGDLDGAESTGCRELRLRLCTENKDWRK